MAGDSHSSGDVPSGDGGWHHPYGTAGTKRSRSRQTAVLRAVRKAHHGLHSHPHGTNVLRFPSLMVLIQNEKFSGNKTVKTVHQRLFVKCNPRLKSFVINILQEYITILMVLVINRKFCVITFSELDH